MKTDNVLDITVKNINLARIIQDGYMLLEYLNKNSLNIVIKHFIIDNIENKDGSPAINNFQIKDFEYKKEGNAGKFRLLFDIERVFCCSDIESSKPDYIDFTFHLENTDLIAHTEYFNWELNN